MDAYGARFSKLLISSLEKKIDDQTMALATTKAIDYADYRDRAGFIGGLKAALEEARDLEHNMDRPETQREAEPIMKHRGYET